jgi:hypothetical protein
MLSGKRSLMQKQPALVLILVDALNRIQYEQLGEFHCKQPIASYLDFAGMEKALCVVLGVELVYATDHDIKGIIPVDGGMSHNVAEVNRHHYLSSSGRTGHLTLYVIYRAVLMWAVQVLCAPVQSAATIDRVHCDGSVERLQGGCA